LLDNYLNQKAAYKAAQRNDEGLVSDEWGQPQYGAKRTVVCRRQAKTQEVLTSDGQKVETSTIYYLVSEVFEGDQLDKLRVVAVAEWVTLGGTPLGWKAFC